MSDRRRRAGGRGRRPDGVLCRWHSWQYERRAKPSVSRGVFEGATRQPAGGGRSVVVGSGSGLSEEPASGCKAGHAGLRVVPVALPGSLQLNGGRRRPGAGRRPSRARRSVLPQRQARGARFGHYVRGWPPPLSDSARPGGGTARRRIAGSGVLSDECRQPPRRREESCSAVPIVPGDIPTGRLVSQSSRSEIQRRPVGWRRSVAEGMGRS
jgi:hypothetical protein